jgi:hypothetical protein
MRYVSQTCIRPRTLMLSLFVPWPMHWLRETLVVLRRLYSTDPKVLPNRGRCGRHANYFGVEEDANMQSNKRATPAAFDGGQYLPYQVASEAGDITCEGTAPAFDASNFNTVRLEYLRKTYPRCLSMQNCFLDPMYLTFSTHLVDTPEQTQSTHHGYTGY